MLGDRIPIDNFVAHCFQKPRVTSLINAWRIEPIRLQEIIVGNFREMGLYFATPDQRESLIETIAYTLKNSAEIRALVRRAEVEESEKRRTRHADV